MSIKMGRTRAAKRTEIIRFGAIRAPNKQTTIIPMYTGVNPARRSEEWVLNAIAKRKKAAINDPMAQNPIAIPWFIFRRTLRFGAARSDVANTALFSINSIENFFGERLRSDVISMKVTICSVFDYLHSFFENFFWFLFIPNDIH